MEKIGTSLFLKLMHSRAVISGFGKSAQNSQHRHQDLQAIYNVRPINPLITETPEEQTIFRWAENILFQILAGKEYDRAKKLVQRILSRSGRRHRKKFIYTFGIEGDKRVLPTNYIE